MHHVWRKPVQETLDLLEMFCDNDICAFNLSFDWFHINKLYNLLSIIGDKRSPPSISEVARICETQPRQYCLKPKRSLDLFLTARRSKWQVLMDRRPIRIKRVPSQLAVRLAETLRRRIPLSPIFFHRRPEKEYKWLVEECQTNPSPEFKDVVLKFGASSGLKPLVKELFNLDSIDAIPHHISPEEDSYNPYDTRWARVMKWHIEWWEMERNIKYATDDVKYLELLYKYFDMPTPGDVDSELAACVGVVRWHGYAISQLAVLERYTKYSQSVHEFKETVCNFDSSPASLRYLHTSATDVERIAIKSTDKVTLDTIKDWPGELGNKAKKLILFRKRSKELNVLEKLMQSRRFNPDFKVIGTKSGRMSGGNDSGIAGGSLNPQGIQRDPAFRSLYTLADPHLELSGGDFEQFEVTIADAAYEDDNLRAVLETGKKFPALLGELLYDEDHDDIVASKGTETDHYTPAKNTTYGLFYGAQEDKLAETAGIHKDRAKQALSEFYEQYPGIRANREFIFEQFCSMRQPDGLGSAISWRDPADFIESLTGFRRYFTLENNICRCFFELAQKMPKMFHVPGEVQRRDKVQTPCGATQSALFAAAFQIQASNMRAACNHVIQSTGADILKEMQRNIWDLQPPGVHKPYVLPMNIHDELQVVHDPYLQGVIAYTVKRTVKEFRKIVPLLSIDWKTGLENWGDK